MRPGTRACYGAATVGAFAGIMLAASGAAIALVVTYNEERVDYTTWMFVAMLSSAGFLVLTMSLFCCACALCRHASSGEEELMEKKMFNGRVHPSVWTLEGSRPAWDSPPDSIPDQLEDMEEDAAEEEILADEEDEPEDEPGDEEEAQDEDEEKEKT